MTEELNNVGLLENLPDAFAYHRLITDNEGNPVDYIYLYANRAFEEMTGLKRETVLGKKVSEVRVGDGQSNPLNLTHIYDWITDGMESVRFEDYFEHERRWCEVTAYRDKPGFYAVIFRYISAAHKEGGFPDRDGLAEKSRQAEEALRKSEENSRLGMEILTYLAESNELPWVIQMVLLKVLEITGFTAGAVRIFGGDNYSILDKESVPYFIDSLKESFESKDVCYHEKKLWDRCLLIQAACNEKIFISEYGSILAGQADDLWHSKALQEDPSTCHKCAQTGYETTAMIPLKTGRETIGLFFLYHLNPGALDQDGLFFLESIIHPFGYAIKHMQDQDSLKESYSKIQSLSSKLLQAYEKERIRLARELHDEVGQNLTALKLDLQLLVRDLKPNHVVGERLAQSIKMMDSIMDRVHTQASSLRPPLLDHMGLLPAINNMADGFSRRTGIAVEINDGGCGKQRLPAETETALFRCVQEALTNVARHARAEHVEIEMEQDAGELALKIRDDGIGFNPKTLSPEKHLGLTGMGERMDLVKGNLDVVAYPGKGTQVRLTVPL